MVRWAEHHSSPVYPPQARAERTPHQRECGRGPRPTSETPACELRAWEGTNTRLFFSFFLFFSSFFSSFFLLFLSCSKESVDSSLEESAAAREAEAG